MVQDLVNYELAHEDIRLKIAIKIPVVHWQNAHLWGDFHFALALRKTLSRKGFDVSIKLKNESVPYFFDVVIVLRGLKTEYVKSGNQLAFLWNISHPSEISDEEFNMYDEIFVASESFANELKGRLHRDVHVLLQCTDDEIFYPEEASFKHQVLFIGNSRNVIRESVSYAIEAGVDLAVYGYGWEGFIPGKYIKSEFVDNKFLHQMYSNTHVLLNDHWEDMKNYNFVSNRIFDALACNARILTDYIEGMESLVPQGLTFYVSKNDFIDKINKMLSEPAIKVSTRNHIIGKHTFNERADHIRELIYKHLSPCK